MEFILQNTEKNPTLRDSFKSLFVDDFASENSDPARAAAGRNEQFASIRANIGTVTLWNILVGYLVVLTFAGDPFFLKSILWYLSFLVAITFTMGRAKGIWRQEEKANEILSDRTLVQLAATLGLIWIAMPLLLFGETGVEQRLFLITIMLSLIGAGAFFLAAIPRAAVIFSMIMVSGLIIAIVVNWHSHLLYSMVLCSIFTLLTIGMIQTNRGFLLDRVDSRVALEESNNMIGVLLREHEDSGHEWLWETNAKGEFCNVSVNFAKAISLNPQNIEGKTLAEILIENSKFSSHENLQSLEAIARAQAVKEPFRDIVVGYQLHNDEDVRWWKLSGRPLLDRNHGGNESDTAYRGVALDITDAKKAENKIAYLALYDSLTNLPNRASFKEQMEYSLAKMHAEGSGLALFMLDLDKFKHINDTLGHPAGDKLLMLVSERLSKECGDAAIVSRLGGDEFAIIMDNVPSCEDAAENARKIISCFREPFPISGRRLWVNCSIGVAFAPDHGDNTVDLVKNVDLALYRAKNDSNSSFNVFEADMDLQVRERRRLGQELQAAISNDELYLLYQPLLCTATNSIIGYEALVRWNNPRCGVVSPEHFIPIAEENGTIVDIGKWVIHQACKQASSWKNNRKVAVNLSPLQFIGIELETEVTLALSKSGLLPSRLELEITENSLIANKDATLLTLQNLRALGVSIALDDFGTGYSSLSYLMSYPFDKIKIDRSFLSNTDELGNNATLIRTIIGLAKSLNMRTTAEGVETLEHLEFLRKEGCDEIQGFLISKPIPPSAIEAGEDTKYLEETEGLLATG